MNQRFLYQPFKLGDLPEPPETFRLDGKTINVAYRDLKFTRQKLDQMVEYHLWGIDPGYLELPINMCKLSALYKLVYYQAPYHRASGWADLIECKMDAGPRLLSCAIANPSPLPVSRFYPKLPDEATAVLQPNYVRPYNAAQGMQDLWLQQHLYSSKKRPSARDGQAGKKKAAVTRVRRGPARRAKSKAVAGLTTKQVFLPVDPQLVQTVIPSDVFNRPVETPPPLPSNVFDPGNPPAQPVETVPSLPSNVFGPGCSPAQPAETMPSLPSNLFHLLNSPAQPIEPLFPLPSSLFNPVNLPAGLVGLASYNVKDVIDSVEKAVLRFAYVDLERHSSATPLTSRPHITATDDEDLFKAVVGSSAAVSYVRMLYNQTADTWNFDVNGNAHPCRGRGPVWRSNSSAVDCAIVVGRLLDAGSTVIDRKQSGWQNDLTAAERAFIEATGLNWDVCTPEDSAGLRDSLWNVLAEADTEIGVGKANPFWSIWSTCTANFAQFQFRYTMQATECQCSGLGATTERFGSSFVHATLGVNDKPGFTMQELVSRYFAPEWVDDCAMCHKRRAVLRQKKFSSLPMRMVVLCDDKRVKNHTQPLEVTYTDDDQNTKTAKYRWLGGVYYKNEHFRVVWTDADRGENDAGDLRFYDGRQNHGLIIGGIAPAHRDDKVPGPWMGTGVFPLLVYERIMDPEPQVLSLAMQSIQDMIAAQKREQLILDLHTPWTRPSPPSELPTQPWARMLPEYGQRFYTLADGRLPGILRNRTRSEQDSIRRVEPSSQLTHAYLNQPLPWSSLSIPFSPVHEAISLSEAVARPGVNQFFIQASPRTLPPPVPTNYPLQSSRNSRNVSPSISLMQVDVETQTIPEELRLPPINSPMWTATPCSQGQSARRSAARKVDKRGHVGQKSGLLGAPKISKPSSRPTRRSARLLRLSDSQASGSS